MRLDRMVVEDAGGNPRRLAAAIHDQLGPAEGAVDVRAVAYALDIFEIRVETLTNAEGALLTTPERGVGSILINGRSPYRRQRFTIAHELGHFLNLWHAPAPDGSSRCTTADLSKLDAGSGKSKGRHHRQEGEANRFAIELLAPHQRLEPILKRTDGLDAVIEIADQLELSREAAARRFAEISDSPVAIAFSKDGRLRYWAHHDDFPRPLIMPNEQMPFLGMRGHSGSISSGDADPDEWLKEPASEELFVQTLYQQGGYAMTLLEIC